MKIVWGGIVSLLALCVIVGCSSNSGPKLYPVSGVVTYKGQPVANAKVMFFPQSGDASAFSHGTTDANGHFKLSTYGLNDGAFAGKCVVTISKIDLPEEAKKIDVQKLQKEGYAGGGMPGYGSMMGVVKGKKKAEAKNELPKKYADKETSGIEVEVKTSGKNEFTYDLE